MQQCPNCGHQNRAGVVFCENCGASLIGIIPLDTKSLDSSSEEEKSQISVDASILTDVKVQGTRTFGKETLLRLEIEGSPEPILFKPKQETIFGRRDPATGAMPDIDLTPYAGYRMGVSRRHAAIRFGDDDTLNLWDLGSSNGTFLNGTRLNAHRPYPLHDGDEIRLGQMIIRVLYQSEKTLAEKPVAHAELPKTDELPPEAPAARPPAAPADASKAPEAKAAPEAPAASEAKVEPQAPAVPQPKAQPDEAPKSAPEKSAPEPAAAAPSEPGKEIKDAIAPATEAPSPAPSPAEDKPVKSEAPTVPDKPAELKPAAEAPAEAKKPADEAPKAPAAPAPPESKTTMPVAKEPATPAEGEVVKPPAAPPKPPQSEAQPEPDKKEKSD